MSDGEHECPACGRVFGTRQGLGQHHSSAHGERLRVDVECAVCGSVIERKPHEAEQSDTHFCSKECESEWKEGRWTREDNPSWSEKVELVCEWCENTYQRIPSAADGSRFCSRDCQTSWQAQERREGPLPERDPDVGCPECGDSFYSEEGMQTHFGMSHGRLEGSCANCGGSITLTLSEWRDNVNKYCDRECFAEHFTGRLQGPRHPRWRDRVGVECDYCGESGAVKPSEVSPNGRWFCDHQCYGNWRSENAVGENHPRWNGGSFPYGEGWNESKKEAVRERDGRECQHCGMGEEDHLEEYGRRLDVHHITPAREIDDPDERNAMDNLITLCRGGCHHTWEQMAPLRPDTAEVAD